MTDDTDKRFAVLCQIQRAQHFAWREAVELLGADAGACVEAMWEVTGRDTARAYGKRLDSGQPLAPQVAECIAWSSRCMGEDARAEVSGPHEAFVRHRACPWLEWHRQKGLLAEDRRGCDVWFQSVIAELNRATGVRLRCETLAALPDGDEACVRRIWQEHGT